MPQKDRFTHQIAEPTITNNHNMQYRIITLFIAIVVLAYFSVILVQNFYLNDPTRVVARTFENFSLQNNLDFLITLKTIQQSSVITPLFFAASSSFPGGGDNGEMNGTTTTSVNGQGYLYIDSEKGLFDADLSLSVTSEMKDVAAESRPVAIHLNAKIFDSNSIFVKVNELSGPDFFDIEKNVWILLFDRGNIMFLPQSKMAAVFGGGDQTFNLLALTDSEASITLPVEIVKIKQLEDVMVDDKRHYNFEIRFSDKEAVELYLIRAFKKLYSSSLSREDIVSLADVVSSLTLQVVINKKNELPRRLKIVDGNESEAIIDFLSYASVRSIERPEKFKKFAEIRSNSEFFMSYSRYFNTIGADYMRNKEFYSATEWFDVAIFLNPDNHSPYYNLGVISTMKGDRQSAIKYYKMAIDVNPDYEPTYGNLVAAYNDNQQCIEGRDVAMEFFKSFPDSQYARYTHRVLGDSYACLGDYDMAIVELEDALRLSEQKDYSNFRLYNDLSVYQKSVENYEAAILNAKKAISILENSPPDHPSDLEISDIESFGLQDVSFFKASAYLNLGSAYYDDAQIDLARRSYEKAVELDPSLYEQHEIFLKYIGVSPQTEKHEILDVAE